MSKLRVCLLPCHEILEYDELSMFHELGYEVHSPGSFVSIENRGDRHLRPSIPGLVYNPDTVEKYHRIGQAFPGEDGKDHLSREYVDCFDVIIVTHIPRWIINNWEVIKDKRVIWRTIGQSIDARENELRPYRQQGLEIVRYSPKEATIPGFIGQDALIRFGKDPVNYGPWNGRNIRVVTFAQSMRQRDLACNFTYFEQITKPFNRHLFGPGNEGLPWSTGQVTYDRLKQEMRDNRVYLYTGTHPASYTLNFMESWMTGVPVVAIGPRKGNASYFPGHDLYEVHELIQNEVNGFWSDDMGKLRGYINALLHDFRLAKQIGEAGRKEAIRHFDRNMIKAAWKSYLENGKAC